MVRQLFYFAYFAALLVLTYATSGTSNNDAEEFLSENNMNVSSSTTDIKYSEDQSLSTECENQL